MSNICSGSTEDLYDVSTSTVEKLLSMLAAQEIVLSDIGDNAPPIQILLGADALGRMMTGRIEIFKSGISAVETRLGCSILGAERRKYAINLVTPSLQNIEIHKLWELLILSKEKDKAFGRRNFNTFSGDY